MVLSPLTSSELVHIKADSCRRARQPATTPSRAHESRCKWRVVLRFAAFGLHVAFLLSLEASILEPSNHISRAPRTLNRFPLFFCLQEDFLTTDPSKLKFDPTMMPTSPRQNSNVPKTNRFLCEFTNARIELPSLFIGDPSIRDHTLIVLVEKVSATNYPQATEVRM